ncbi:MAG: methionine synthase [Candidatus Rokubacteria bacterium]|nr:methionine synthase [Candidatus Rokubacteria bacterium]MBI2015675.1 methionine synthase [Candidatus Rokubacteria bacterium]MBI4254975.1 methionine synthase [Candidatus Rokubacteria bacterium]
MTLPLIPSSVVGSHGKPGWWFAGVKALERGEFGPGDLEEMFDDAADTAIRDMERAGIDVVTDGEMRRLDGYVDTYYAIIKGIEPLPVRRRAGPWGYDQQTRYEAVGRIETPPGGLGIVKEFEYLKTHTARRTKATCAGPLTFGSRIHPGRMYKGVVDVAERFAEVINAELRGLAAAGAELIQIDEPARGNVSGEEMARLFNLATAGVTAKLGFHICFGNRFGRSRFPRTYAPYFPGLLEARADQFVLEFAGREMAELDLWKTHGDGRELGAGVVDVKGFNQDTPEDVAKRIRRVLEVCPAEKLTVNPDCGFGWSPRYLCNQKITALAAGAALVRRELTGGR